MMGRALAGALLAALIAYFLTPAVIRLAHRIGAVDHPNERKVHEGVMPRLGGLSFFAAFLAAALLLGEKTPYLTGLLLADGILVGLGVVDDTRGVGPKTKLLGQFLAALLLVEFGFLIDFINLPLGGASLLFLSRASLLVTVLWLVGITNAVNLIDGLDGLATGTGFIALAAISVVAFLTGLTEAMVLGMILAGALLGFLPHNFYPARIFMGDTGSMLLGFNVAAIAILGMTKSVTFISLVLPVVILGVPILDTAMAILRRASCGRRVFEADREHLHHRLLHLGISHRNTVLLIYAINAGLGVAAVFIQNLDTLSSLLVLLVLAALLLLLAVRLGLAAESPRR